MKNLKIRWKMLIFSFSAAALIILVWLFSISFAERTKIGSALYQEIILSNELTADILPPPEYVVESYCTTLRYIGAKDSAQQAELLAQIDKLEADYNSRHSYWLDALPKQGDLTQAFLTDSYDSAIAFYAIFHDQVIPAVSAGDSIGIQIAMAALENAYEKHRAAIDTTVISAETWRQSVIQKAEEASALNDRLMIALIVIAIVIGVVISFFISHALVESVKYIHKVLRRIADGDLTTVIEEKQISRDEIGQLCLSAKITSQRLNTILSAISSSASQVNKKALRISDTAQSLAQGVSQQASSVEELAATVNEITEQVQSNASSASKAKELSLTASKDVTQGSAQMNQMMRAMDDISASSGEISKIIKVIDDIAFQTNILALNAAIEAARAGQAGKGFAVVAQEVRNLAAKSAEAAKTTTKFIESSIAKVSEGIRIANSTDRSLSEIVQRVEEVSSLIQHIDAASAEQSSALKQVTLGIEQISTVVQTNSAKAEDSAAASEELLGQAKFMSKQASQFKVHAEGAAGVLPPM